MQGKSARLRNNPFVPLIKLTLYITVSSRFFEEKNWISKNLEQIYGILASGYRDLQNWIVMTVVRHIGVLKIWQQAWSRKCCIFSGYPSSVSDPNSLNKDPDPGWRWIRIILEIFSLYRGHYDMAKNHLTLLSL
jgi:hypothetical protein